MKKNEKGFGAVGILIIVLVVGLIGAVGFSIYNRQSKNKTEATNSTNSTIKPIDNTTATQAEDKLEKYCDPVEKTCISYGSNWSKKIEKFNQEAIERAKVTLENKTNRKLIISFNPYIYGIGGNNCSSPTTILSVDKTAANNTVNIVKSVSLLQEINDSKVTKEYYTVGFGLMSDEFVSNQKIKVGKSDCIPLLGYDNKNAKNDGFGSLSVNPGKEFATENEASVWLESAEAKEAETVLKTLEIN